MLRALADVQPFVDVVPFERLFRLEICLEFVDVLLERFDGLVGGVLGVVHDEEHVEGVFVESFGIYGPVRGLGVQRRFREV